MTPSEPEIPMTASKSRRRPAKSTPKSKAGSSRPVAKKAGKPRAKGMKTVAAERPAGRSTSKQARVLALLHASAGATLASMMQSTGWQAHSIRGFLAGVVRKKLNLNLVSEESEKGRVYRIKSDKARSGTKPIPLSDPRLVRESFHETSQTRV